MLTTRVQTKKAQNSPYKAAFIDAMGEKSEKNTQKKQKTENALGSRDTMRDITTKSVTCEDKQQPED